MANQPTSLTFFLAFSPKGKQSFPFIPYPKAKESSDGARNPGHMLCDADAIAIASHGLGREEEDDAS